MNIRLATYQDLAAITALDAQTNLNPWSSQSFQAALNHEQDWVYVAQSANQLQGLIVWQQIVDEIHLHLLATAIDVRRQGIATQLMNILFQAAATQNIQRILLEVRQSNQNAQNLYHKLGFITIATRKNYYAGTENAVIMEKTC